MSKDIAVEPGNNEAKPLEAALPSGEVNPPETLVAVALEQDKEAAKSEESPKKDKKPAQKELKAKKVVPKKPKLIRDSFTIPEADYALFASLKQRALHAGIEIKKGEILRAALQVLARLDDAELSKAIALVERIKTGRPKK